MTNLILKTVCFSVFLLTSFTAFADETQLTCDGFFNSKQKADQSDPQTISVRAHLVAVVMYDENAKGEYELKKAKLTLVATNESNLDAGSYTKTKPLKGKMNQAHDSKYKDYIRFDLGSKQSAAYGQSFDFPETYLMIPTNDSNIVYVQRSGTGHDTYPTLTLTCH